MPGLRPPGIKVSSVERLRPHRWSVPDTRRVSETLERSLRLQLSGPPGISVWLLFAYYTVMCMNSFVTYSWCIHTVDMCSLGLFFPLFTYYIKHALGARCLANSFAPVAIFVRIFGVPMNILFVGEVEILVFIKWSLEVNLIVFSIKSRMANIFEHRVIVLYHTIFSLSNFRSTHNHEPLKNTSVYVIVVLESCVFALCSFHSLWCLCVWNGICYEHLFLGCMQYRSTIAGSSKNNVQIIKS